MTASQNPFAPNPDLRVFLDGVIVLVDEAKISVFDHGLLYGDGVFEGIRAYGGKIFECAAHLRRLFDSAKAIRLDIPMTAEQIEKAMYDTLAANQIVDGYIRLVVTRGVGYLGLAVTRTGCPSVIVIADQIELYPKEMYEKGMEVITSTVIRNHPNALSPRVKSLNYLNNILAKIEAIDAGVPEAIMFNHEGLVSECTGDNLFLVRDGQLQTPPTSAGILEGVTRDVVIRLAQRAGIPLEEKNLTRHDLYIADECFLTGTAAELISVTKVDGRTIGDGSPGLITKQLLEAFHRYCRSEAG